MDILLGNSTREGMGDFEQGPRHRLAAFHSMIFGKIYYKLKKIAIECIEENLIDQSFEDNDMRSGRLDVGKLIKLIKNKSILPLYRR